MNQLQALGHNAPKPEWFGRKNDEASLAKADKHCFMCLCTEVPFELWIKLRDRPKGKDRYVCSDYCYANYCMGHDLV